MPATSCPMERMLKRSQETSTGCRIWTGALSAGYGAIGWKNKVYRTHRLMYELLHGPLESNLDVAHTCHNKKCINPEHLISTTRAQNLNMSRREGRLLKKLTYQQVQLIRALYRAKKPGITNNLFAESFAPLFSISRRNFAMTMLGEVNKEIPNG